MADTGSVVALLGLLGLDILKTFRFSKDSSHLIASCSCSMGMISSFFSQGYCNHLVAFLLLTQLPPGGFGSL